MTLDTDTQQEDPVRLLQVGEIFRFDQKVQAIRLKSPLGGSDSEFHAPSNMLKGTYKPDLLGEELHISIDEKLEVIRTYTSIHGYVAIARFKCMHDIHFYPVDGTCTPLGVTRLLVVLERPQ